MSESPHDFGSEVRAAIAADADALATLSGEIWQTPELGYKETHAHTVLTNYLDRHGFRVERAYKGLATAFRAEFGASAYGKSGDDDLITVCIICEYDALPGIGHACGHNLIAEAGVAAAVATKQVLERLLQATDNDEATKQALQRARVVCMGTPAEEMGGGKCDLIKQGAFDDVTVAMMVHPTPEDNLYPTSLCVDMCRVDFTGRSAHAAMAPHQGVNALDACVAAYVAVSNARQQFPSAWRVHGVITEGGVKPNIVPAKTQMYFYLRTATPADLVTLKQRFMACCRGAAQASGCAVDFGWDKNPYLSIRTNSVLAESMRRHGRAGGDGTDAAGNRVTGDGGDVGGGSGVERVVFDSVAIDAAKPCGSTDMGNVSQCVPSIHPCFDIVSGQRPEAFAAADALVAAKAAAEAEAAAAAAASGEFGPGASPIASELATKVHDAVSVPQCCGWGVPLQHEAAEPTAKKQKTRPRFIGNHTPGFTALSNTEHAHARTRTFAALMSLTALDVLVARPGMAAECVAEFKAATGGGQ